MDRQFPPLMLADMKHPAVKAAWVSDYPHLSPDDCYNCGGSGHVTLQAALAGPFKSPFTSAELHAKSDVVNGNLIWWGVKTTAYECPVCHGGKAIKTDTIPVKNEINKLADAWENRRDLE